jgi:hypothetical protein
VNPFNQIGFDDDWSYSRVALKLAETGRLQYNGWGSPLQLFQTLWAFPWLKIFGSSYPVLQVATIPVSLGFVLLVYATGLRAGLSRQLAACCAIGTGTSPLFLPFAASFMTESYACFFGMACIYCAIRAVQESEPETAARWLWALTLAGIVGGANRQSVWAAPLALIPWIAWERRSERGTLPTCLAAFAALCGSAAAILHWFGQPYPGLQIGRGLWAWLLLHRSGAALGFLGEFLLLCVLLCLPVFASLLPRVRGRQIVWLLPGLVALGFITFLGIVAGWPSAPYGNDMITLRGIAVGNENAPGAAVVVLTFWPVVLLTAAVNLCAPAALFSLRKLVREPAPCAERSFLRLAGLFTMSYLPLIFPGLLLNIAFDRYMLPLVPLLYLAISLRANRGRPRMAAAWACLFLFAGYAVAATHDYAEASRARVAAARAFERSGVSRSRISASFEYNGQAQLDRAGFVRGTQYSDRFADRGPRGFQLEFWNHLTGFAPDFVVLNWTRPEPPHGCEAFVEYRAWLPPFRRYAAVWKRTDLTAELRLAEMLSEAPPWR